jgi:hypothetical protein
MPVKVVFCIEVRAEGTNLPLSHGFQDIDLDQAKLDGMLCFVWSTW